MRASRQTVLWVLIALAAVAGVSAARADNVASPEDIRALRVKLAKSPPKPADYAAQPYPGATFDADCSAQHTAPRQPDGAVYCFYSLDPVDKVEAFVKADGKPRNGVFATVGEDVVAVDGDVKIDKVTMITYWTSRSGMAFYQSFPDNPPPAAELIAPLYPGATYDKECSAAKALEIRSKPRWRQVWCYVVNEPLGTVSNAFDMELTSTSKRGVQVDLTEVSRTPPVTQIEYWLTSDPPQASAAASTPASAPPSDAATSASDGSSGSTTSPKTGPAPAQPDAAKKTKEAVNKLRGLLGH